MLSTNNLRNNLKQILQNLSSGITELTDIPCPAYDSGQILIRSSCSLISAGTERMLIDFSKANFVEKARQQPDKVRMVLDKIKTDGLLPTIDAVRGKLDQPIPLGYCNVGKILSLGSQVVGFNVGDRIASNGVHAEVVAVPVNLCAKIPDNVSDESAAFNCCGCNCIARGSFGKSNSRRSRSGNRVGFNWSTYRAITSSKWLQGFRH